MVNESRVTYKFKHSAFMDGAEVVDAYQAMKNHRVADIVLYDGAITSWQQWLDFARSDMCWMVKCIHPTRGFVGLWWLTGFVGRTAMMHFCVFDVLETFEKKVEMGRQGLQWLYSLGAIDSVYGLTPAPYRHVWPYQDALGLHRVGRLPGACYLSRRGKYVDGVISTLNLAERYGQPVGVC